MFVILNDEQTLMQYPQGLSLEVVEVEKYCANGFWYELFILDSSSVDFDLFVVRKCVSETEFDTFVCYKPFDIEFGERNLFPFLFNPDDSYVSQVDNTSGVTFAGNLTGVDCEVDYDEFVKPGKISEYQAPDNEDNPFIFVFEAINEETHVSYISYICGCRVNEKEVEVL